MDRVNLGCSTKNNPLHCKKEVRLNLIQKTMKFFGSLRWKAYFHLNPNKRPKNKNYYGFNSPKSAPPVPQLKEFQDGMINLVQI